MFSSLIQQTYGQWFGDLCFGNIAYTAKETPSKALLYLPTLRDNRGRGLRKNYRSGFCVDQFWTQRYLDYYSDRVVFTALDCLADNVVNIPLGFIAGSNIAQNTDYYTSYKPQTQCFDKVFWKGSSITHEIRLKLLKHLKQKRDNRFLLRHWHRKGNPYGIVKPASFEYVSYFNLLSVSDAFLVMRGDKPWLYSFFDCLRAGAIPVCVDTFYGQLGWENIGIRTEDIILDLSTRTQTFDDIYFAIVELLENKEKVLHMKRIGQQFMQKYVFSDQLLAAHGASGYFAGWGDFIAAKLLETARNGYALVNNSLICQTVDEVKHEIQSQKAY